MLCRTRSLIVALVITVAGPCFAQVSPVSPKQPYGSLPVTFEPNQGQTDPRVQFVSRAPGYTAFLSAGEITLSLRDKRSAKSGLAVDPSSSRSDKRPNQVIQFKLVGTLPNPAAVGEDPQPGRINYFIGKDSSQWRRNIPTYGRVRYKNVYPGIDLVYYGSKGQLEYDFSLSPGADPGTVQFEVKGAHEVAISASGDLVLNPGGSELHFEAPVIYQESNGARIPIPGKFVQKSATRIGFQVESYDPTKALVIDPVLIYSTYLGGSGNDQPTGLAVDKSGCVYISGYTDSTDFPSATLGSLPGGQTHAFVAKLDATGSSLIYADYLGGNGFDYGYALALDSAAEVYVTGSTSSSDFPVVNAYQAQYPGSFNAFVSQISADGSSLLYSTYLGGNGSDIPSGVAVDSASDVIIAGYTSSTNFPVSNAFQPTVSANDGGLYGNYGFVTKFVPDGSALVYSTYLAGSSNVPYNCGSPCWGAPDTQISGLALDGNGNAYLTGYTNTYNFPVSNGAYATTNSTQLNQIVGFVTKLTSAGSLAYSTYFYESFGFTNITAIAVDTAGSAYVTGLAFSDGTFPITSTTICDPGIYGSACSYGFVTKFDPAGSTLVYSTFLGPNNDAIPSSIIVDSNSNAYVAASTGSSGFGLVGGLEDYSGGSDVLLVQIDSVAGSELFATYLGGSSDESTASMAVDPSGNVYLAGLTDSADFPTTQSAFQAEAPGNKNGFLVKIGPSSEPFTSITPKALQFPAIQIGSTSQAQQLVLRNMGSSALTISSITTSGDFAETDNCGGTVAAAGSCSLAVTFTPTTAGSRNGAIAIADNASGSPQSVPLSGTGLGIPAPVFTPASLAFSSTPIGTSSSPQMVSLANQGSAVLNIIGIQVSGDFSQTNNCPAALVPSSSCIFNIIFTPAASGSRTGILTVSDDASGSPHSVPLSGTGLGIPVPVFTPASLAFSSTPIGTSSSPQVVTLNNQGSGVLNISSIQVSGDFSQTNNCPAALAPSSSCTFNIIFTPAASGSRTGMLTVSDDASGSPQAVPLSGAGLGPAVVVLSPTNLIFSSIPIGSSSAAQTVTLTNQGSSALVISSIQVTGNFAQSNNCPSSLAPTSTCNISVTFTPTASGNRSGALTVNDSATGTPQSVALSGVGTDFTITSSAVTSTVKAGATATYALSISPVGTSFSNQITLRCAGEPANSKCIFSPPSVTPGSSPASVNLTITTSSFSAAALSFFPTRVGPVYGILLPFPGLGLFGLFLTRTPKQQRKKIFLVITLAVIAISVLFMPACAGGTGVVPTGGSGTAPGTYPITVTASSATLQHAVTLTLTVQ